MVAHISIVSDDLVRPAAVIQVWRQLPSGATPHLATLSGRTSGSGAPEPVRSQKLLSTSYDRKLSFAPPIKLLSYYKALMGVFTWDEELIVITWVLFHFQRSRTHGRTLPRRGNALSSENSGHDSLTCAETRASGRLAPVVCMGGTVRYASTREVSKCVISHKVAHDCIVGDNSCAVNCGDFSQPTAAKWS